MYSVCVKKSLPPIFDLIIFFPKRLEIFSPYFTRLLYVPIYAGLQIVIQFSSTLTKLRHIKRDHHAQNAHHRLKRMLGGRTKYGITSLQLEFIG